MGRLYIYYNSKLPWQRYCWSLSKQSHNAGCQVRGQAKAQESNYCITLQYCIFKTLTTWTDALRYLHTHPLRSLLPFFFSTYLSLFSLLSFLSWVISFHPLFIHYFLLPAVSFFPYTSTPFIHSFSHSSFCFFYSVVTTTILYSLHPLSFFFLPWLKGPVVFLSRFKRKSRQTDTFQTLSYKPAHY